MAGVLRRVARRRSLNCVWVLITLTWAGVLPARAADPAEQRAAAVKLAGEGSTAYKAEDYRTALDRFSAAYRVFPEPRLLLNISRASWKLNRCDDALRYAALYQKAAPPVPEGSPDAPDSWLVTLQRGCIDVEITSTPPDGTVWINGERQTSPGKTPWVGRLPAGSYHVLVWLAGYQKRNVYLEVSATEPTRASLPLVPESGSSAEYPSGQPAEPPYSLVAAPPAQESPALPAVALAAAPGRSMSTARQAGIAGAAVGGAALIVAIGLGVSAVSATASGKTREPTTSIQSEVGGADGLATGANVLFVLGGVLAAAGAGVAIAFP